ncbi:hypothetical protein [Vibrio furnissii]|uniref:hypothetical protein n=1 Tax=Vibrio furnissii TaxID=29494 RepID=UPI001EECEAC5|nr:hypothetical protein [Vibrio furnissii]MCG6214715.1 hypothetical protein [Vibrio furnissii]
MNNHSEITAYYYRLILSYSDFKHAAKCAMQLQKYSDNYDPATATIEEALYSSMLVSLARPFNSSGSSSSGKVNRLEKKVLSILDPSERELFDYVLLCRNKYIAHSDAEYIEPDPVVIEGENVNTVIAYKTDSLAPLKQEYVVKVGDIAEKLRVFCMEERCRIEGEIIHKFPRISIEEFGEQK